MDETREEQSGTAEPGSTVETEIQQLRERHRAQLDQLSQLMGSLQHLSESVSGEDAALENLEQSARGQLDYLRRSLEETVANQSDCESRVRELTEALEAGEREIASLRESAASAEGGNAELDAVRAELAARDEAVADLEGRLEALRNEQQGDGEALAEARARAEEAESKLAGLEEELAGRAREADTQQEQIDRLQQELAEKDRALEEARAELAGASDETAQLRDAQQQAEATEEGLRTELRAVQREAESMRERYRDGLSTEAALALRQQVADTAEEVKRLEEELAAARTQGRKSALAQQLAEAIGESERLEEENERLKEQLGIAGAGPAGEGAPPLEPAGVTREEPHVSRSPEDELQRIQQSAQGWSHGPKRVIGQILLDAGVITEEQLETALDLQKSNPQQHLGALLAELGFASDEAIAQARASQCGVEFIRFDEHTVDPEAASLITPRLASQHTCIPISATKSDMVLAVTNPMDLLAIEDVERFTNRKVDVVVATGPEIAEAISRYYWEPE